MQYFTQVHCSHCLLVFTIQEVKGLTKKLYLLILSRRKTSFYAIFIVYNGYGLHYNTRSKRVNEEIVLRFTVHEEDQFLCKLSGSLFLLHCCGLHYNLLSGLSVKRVNNKLYNCALPRKKTVYLQIFRFIGATVSEFYFFMKIKNIM